MKRTNVLFFATTLSLVAGSACAAASGDALYKALVNTSPTNLPSGFNSAAPTAIPQHFAGLVGEVDLVFQGGDPKARLGFFVFTDFNTASEFNRKYLPPLGPGVPGYKLLAYPPMARCVEMPEKGGYCDMWIQDY